MLMESNGVDGGSKMSKELHDSADGVGGATIILVAVNRSGSRIMRKENNNYGWKIKGNKKIFL